VIIYFYKKHREEQAISGKIIENIRFFIQRGYQQCRIKSFDINMLKIVYHNLSTIFAQKLWKTFKNPVYSKVCMVLLCMVVLFSCSSTKKTNSVLENSIISMSEEEVRKKLGEPDIVSKTPENNIIWTYKPQWKIMPDNKNTIYVEFKDGQAIKIIKAR